MVNAEGGNQTENGGLPRPAVEEEEDEDDPDKLMGKFFSHVLFKTEHGNQLYEMFSLCTINFYTLLRGTDLLCLVLLFLSALPVVCIIYKDK